MPSQHRTTELAKLLYDAFRRATLRAGWTTADELEAAIRRVEPSFMPQRFGYEKTPTLLANCGDLVETQLDKSRTPPVLLVRLRRTNTASSMSAAPDAVTARTQTDIAARPLDVRPRPIRQSSAEIMNWAWMQDLPSTLTALAALALDERWWFGDDIDLSFPILWNYFRFTFVRLKYENKLCEITDPGAQVAAFNTGLVDKRYEPIYALFRANVNQSRQRWRFSSFCIAGEGRDGKDLVRNFNPLPRPPHYFSRIQDMIYDVNAGKPEVDWEHVIIENVQRLPVDFIKDHVPSGFAFSEPGSMSVDERAAFFERLSNAVRSDSRTYRAIKNRLADALELAVKRTRWNFKTAIPHYYPREHRVNLLLPLAVVSDDQVDLALVVEKTKAGNYLGHTILPLNWAYMHARLVCRPDSDWLVPKAIASDASEQDDRDEVQ